LRAGDPLPVRVGWAATIEVTIEARGLAGTTSAIALESQGVELSRVEHKWTADPERHTASLRYTPPREGASVVTVKAIPVEREQTTTDNAVDLRLVATGQRLKVLVHQPRLSWNATFVRRTLEDDPAFDVSSVARASKGLMVLAGSPPPALTAEALAGFDAVVIGAPEELREADVDALRQFASRRGGAVVLVPDRRPAGPYVALMPARAFDEVLIEEPAVLSSVAGGRLRASEMAIPRASDTGLGTLLATAEQGKVARPVVIEWLAGEGRVLFSGALDAWRYRGGDDEGFSRFWRARIAEAAMAAPPRAAVSVVPGVPGVGEEAVIRVRLRPTEFETSDSRTRVPAAGARLIDATGKVEAVRLWPSSAMGTFEGRVRFAHAGDYDLRIALGSGLELDRIVTVASAARHPVPSAESTADAMRLLAASTGGVAVTDRDMGPLERHLRGLAAGAAERRVHPWQSAWMIVAFVALVSIEWLTRRRRGSA
jgi:hypothetical protein